MTFEELEGLYKTLQRINEEQRSEISQWKKRAHAAELKVCALQSELRQLTEPKPQPPPPPMVLSAFRICGLLGPGELPSSADRVIADFHRNSILEECDRKARRGKADWPSDSQLAYRLAVRMVPEFGVKLPWWIRLTRGRWI